MDRRYDDSLKELQKLEPPKPAYEGFLYQLRGSAQFHKAMRSKDEQERAAYLERAKRDFEQAERIALFWGGVQGVRVALLSSCRPYIGQTSREANVEAVKCLNKIKEHVVADYTTCFNLATKYGRLGRDELALQNLEACIALGGHRPIPRSDVLLGGAFDELMKGRHKERFMKLLKLFKV